MDIQNNNVSIQINAKDLSGRRLRVADCDLFIVHVFTDDPKFYLTFSGRDILATEFVDELVVPKHQMQQLRSGVVQYTYHYLPKNHDCVYNAPEFDADFDNRIDEVVETPKHHHHFHHAHAHEQLINSRPIITEIYWRNVEHNPHCHALPANTVSHFDIERLHHLIEKEHKDRKADFAELKAIFTDEFDSKLVAEIDRSTAEDERLSTEIEDIKQTISEDVDKAAEETNKILDEVANVSDAIVAETNRATQKEIELQQLIAGEEARAKGEEEVISVKIQMEKERAMTNEANLLDRVSSVSDKFDAFKTLSTDTINSEIARAKASESALNIKIDGVVADLQAEVSRAAAKDIEHTNLVETEANRAKAVENKIATDLTTEIGRATDAEKHIIDEVHALQTTVSNLATATNVYTKAETDKKIADVKNDVSTIENWINNHTDNTDELKANVSQLVKDTQKISTDLSDEVTARTNADLTINTNITIVDGKVDAEVARATATEAAINSEIVDIKSLIAEKSSTNADAIAAVEAELTKEVARAKAAEKVNADAIAILNGDVSTNGSIKKSLADAKDYTDAEISKLNLSIDSSVANTLKSYATNAEVDKKISDVIGTAPEALDTLGKISSALSADNDAITAINGVLAGKANSADVYSKTDIDTKVTDIQNVISTLETKSDNADATINGRIDDVNVKIGNIEAKAVLDSSVMSDALANETAERKAADKVISDKVDAEVEKLNGKISDLTATVISDIAKSDAKDIELQALIDANAAAIATETNRAKQVETEINDKINSLNLDAANSSISALNDKVDSEISRATAAEKVIDDKVEALTTKVNGIDLDSLNSSISVLDTKIDNTKSSLETEIANEVNRAKSVEADFVVKISVINGDADTIGSIAHALHDAEHYTDDEIAKVTSALEIHISEAESKYLTEHQSLEDYVTKENLRSEVDYAIAKNQDIKDLQSDLLAEVVRAKAAENSIVESIQNVSDTLEAAIEDLNNMFGGETGEGGVISGGSVNLDDYYTKDEVNDLIVNSLSNTLTDYPTTEVVAEMVDNKADTDNVYSKTEADSKFMQFVTMTADEYEALEDVDENVFYVII